VVDPRTNALLKTVNPPKYMQHDMTWLYVIAHRRAFFSRAGPRHRINVQAYRLPHHSHELWPHY